jgi:hypothetical protein
MLYVVAVALIWIAASFLVQSVVDSGVSPFLISYICNTLFLVYIPVVEIGRVSQRLLAKGAADDGSAGQQPPAPAADLPESLKDSETQTLLEPPHEAASDQAFLAANGSPLVSDDHGMYATTTMQTFCHRHVYKCRGRERSVYSQNK